MASGSQALSAVLGAAASAGDARDQAAPQTLTCRVPPDMLADELLDAVDELVPYAPELAAIRRRLWAWQNPAAGAPALSARTVAKRMRGVELAWTLTVVLRPTLRHLYDLAKPGQYLPPFEVTLRGLLWRARRAYCTTIAKALDAEPVNVLEAWQDDGGRLIGEFRAKLQDLYLYDAKGLEAQIRDMADTAVDLIALRAERGTDAFPNRAADAELRITTTPAGGPWSLREPLLTELQQVRDYEFADQAEKYLRFSQKLRGLGLALQVLAARERLAWLADQAIFSSAADRLDGYAVELGDALTRIETGITQFKQGNFVASADTLRLATAEVAGVTGRPAFQEDIDAVADRIVLQAQFKAFVAGLAIAAASALTAGAVGAVAAVAIADLVGTTTVAGVVIVAAGAVTARMLWETLVARTGSELLLGPDSIKDSSFLEDFGWQVLQTAAVRIVMFGAGDVFKAVARAGKKAEAAARIAVEQISTFAFGEVQFLVRTGRLHTLREGVFAAMQQVASTGVVMSGGLMLTRFVDRLGTAQSALTVPGQQRLVELEGQRAQLESEFDPIRNGTADEAQFRAWAGRAAEVWNGFVALVREEMQTGADQTAMLGKLAAAKGEIELRLAELGISATFTLPDAVPMFEGLLPGLVAYSDDGQPVLDTAYPPARRLPSGDPDTVLALGTGGRRALFLPAGDLPAKAPPPPRLAHVAEASAVPGVPDQPVVLPGAATVGLQRLRGAMGADKVTRLLAQVPPGQVDAFLSLLAHPDLAAVGAVQTRSKALAGLASHPPSLAFGRRWGPLLALRMRRRLGTGRGLDDGLARADGLLQGTPAADRPALIGRLMGLSSGALRRELALSPPLRAPRRRITAANLGIDQNHPQWATLLQEVQRDFPGLPPAQLRVLADCLQVIEVAATGAFKDFPAQTKLNVLIDFEQRMVDGQLRTQLRAIVANRLRGRLAEHVFLGPLPVAQQTMWLGRVPIYEWLTGRSNMDAQWMVGQAHAFGELKSDDIHLQNPSQIEATARQYLADATGDFENIPDGSTYYLWFIRDPGSAGRQRMQTILMGPGSRITGVFFGPETPPPFPKK